MIWNFLKFWWLYLKNKFGFEISPEESLEIILRYQGRKEKPIQTLLKSVISKNFILIDTDLSNMIHEKIEIDEFGNYNPWKLISGYSFWNSEWSKETKNLIKMLDVLIKNKDKEN